MSPDISREEVLAALEKALDGSQVLKMTFRPEASNVIAHYMMGMLFVNLFSVPEESAGQVVNLLRKLASSEKWPQDQSRTVEVCLTSQFRGDEVRRFINRLFDRLESIEAVSKR